MPHTPHTNDTFQEDTRTNPHQLSFFLVLDGYEGPIDLLLELAREQKIDLAEIAILPLAEQYLAYITRAEELDIDIAADYLVMAAWLAYLKSRLLLPEPEPDEALETLDMAEALKQQLLRLEAMRKASQDLMALPRLGRARFRSGRNWHPQTQTRIAHQANLYDLLEAYGQIAGRQDAETLTITASHLYSIEEAVARLSVLVKDSKGWNNLLSFLPPNLKNALDCRSALAAHFSASLEMVRDGQAQLRQDRQFGDIYLTASEQK